jgi:regulator of replication initiation timing
MEVNTETLQKQLDDTTERFNQLGQLIEQTAKEIEEAKKKIEAAVNEQRTLQGKYSVLAELLNKNKTEETSPEEIKAETTE